MDAKYALRFSENNKGHYSYTTSRGSEVIAYKKPNGSYGWFIADKDNDLSYAAPNPKLVLVEEDKEFYSLEEILDQITDVFTSMYHNRYSWIITKLELNGGIEDA